MVRGWEGAGYLEFLSPLSRWWAAPLRSSEFILVKTRQTDQDSPHGAAPGEPHSAARQRSSGRGGKRARRGREVRRGGTRVERYSELAHSYSMGELTVLCAVFCSFPSRYSNQYMESYLLSCASLLFVLDRPQTQITVLDSDTQYIYNDSAFSCETMFDQLSAHRRSLASTASHVLASSVTCVW